jgi:cellulose synthase/poly-beta-1,6-N-acetylglucosamine synthase-like glycosyltransferase
VIHLLHDLVLAFNIFVIGYMTAQVLNQLMLISFGWREISEYVKRKSLRDYATIASSELSVPVSIVVPAYNEEGVIAESVRSLLNSHYAAFEVVVVNDGSNDRTLDVLIDEYALVPHERVPRAQLETRPVVGSYRSLSDERLVVIDKENGGSRADAVNAGLRYARYPLFLAVDADTLLDIDALPRLVREFQVRPETVALGGIVRIANGSTVEAGHVTEARTPRELLVNLQIVEYLRAFLVGRTGWSRIGAVLIVSGAFGIFRREEVVEAGGYRADSFAEDAELVVRLHKLCRERGRPYRIGFIADPVCWTEAPSSLGVLRSQRERWQRGLLEVLWTFRGMIGRRRYGTVGLLALPYFLLFEALGPIIEVAGYFVITLSLILGWLPPLVAIAFFGVAVAFGIAFSFGALLVEERAFQRYRRWSCFGRLVLAAGLENLGYRQWYALVRVRATWSHLRGHHQEWGEMERTGFNPESVPAKS